MAFRRYMRKARTFARAHRGFIRGALRLASNAPYIGEGVRTARAIAGVVRRSRVIPRARKLIRSYRRR